jgi:CheY-like chemotaxis protein
MEQIVMNLVNNAIDAVKDQPRPRVIAVTTEETTSYLRLCVKDSGPGIAAAIRDKIFDPFFTTKPIGRGTGLGLTICNTYAQEHRGKIWLESEPDKGAAFFMDLPLLPCGGTVPAEVETVPAAPVTITENVGQKLLIIDDEPDIVGVLESILTESGFTIKTASDGNEALQILSNDSFDVILSDMRMPGLDWQALYHRLSAAKPAQAQRMIFVTGDTVSSKTRDFLDSTGNLWVNKPFRINDVISRVQEVLQRCPAVVADGVAANLLVK